MSKNSLILISILALVVGSFFLKSLLTSQIEGSSEEQNREILTPTITRDNNKIFETIEATLGDYHAVAAVLKYASSLHLISNFAESLSSEAAMEQYNCQLISSAGLYTKENTPIGLFISDGVQLKSKMPNSFFNGMFSLSYDGVANISDQLPEGNLRIGIQSGPILLSEGKIQNFEKRNDDESRRIVIAVGKNGEVVLLTFYKKDSVFMGPKLEELPELLLTFSKNSGFSLSSALNLDGGSASAFRTESLSLSELTSSGSFFCIK